MSAANPQKKQPDASVPQVASGAPAPDIQQLWFSLRRKEWTSLALLPAAPGLSALGLGNSLATMGELHRGTPIQVLSAEGMGLKAATGLVVQMAQEVAAGRQVILVMDSVLVNQSGIPLVLAADAVLLCVKLGDTEVGAARRTLELVGEEKVLGAATLRSW